MNPVAFNLFGINIMWYALLITFGVVIALLITNFNTKRKIIRVTYENITDAFLYAFPLAIIGARAYYVIFEWERYKGNLLSMINIREGGLAIHGGLIGAVIGVLIYKAVSKTSTRKILNMADCVAPAIILAQGIGRWGNFINKEAHGGEVTKEFISRFPQFIQNGMLIGGKYYHPTFLYESAWNLLGFIILMILFWRRKKGHEGTILAWYMIIYSIGRYFIEGMRTDSLMLGSLRQAQIISLVMIAVGIIYLIYKYTHPSPDTEEIVTVEESKTVTKVSSGESVLHEDK